MWGGALGNHQGGLTGFTTLWLCVGGGLSEGSVPDFWGFAWHLPHFQSLRLLLMWDWCPSKAVALVLNPRVGGFVYILRLFGPFKHSFWKSSSFFHLPNPHCFIQPEVTAIYLLGTGTLGCVVWSEVGVTHSQGIPTDFYPPHMNVGPSVPILPSCHLSVPHHRHHISLPLWPSYLSGWMWLLYILGCQTSIQLNFLMVLGVTCFEI